MRIMRTGSYAPGTANRYNVSLGVAHKETLSYYTKKQATLTVLKTVFAMSNILSAMKTIYCSYMYLVVCFPLS